MLAPKRKKKREKTRQKPIGARDKKSKIKRLKKRQKKFLKKKRHEKVGKKKGELELGKQTDRIGKATHEKKTPK